MLKRILKALRGEGVHFSGSMNAEAARRVRELKERTGHDFNDLLRNALGLYDTCTACLNDSDGIDGRQLAIIDKNEKVIAIIQVR